MIRRHVLAALATGVAAGTDDAAREAITRTEWPLRGSARRELERALIDAALISRAADMRHVQRVAALTLAGHYDVDATQPAAVADAYEKLPPPYVSPLPVATIAISCGALALLALLAWTVVMLRTPHHRDRNPPTMPWGAFATGGKPATDPVLEKVLGEQLPAFVIRTDEDRHAGASPRVHAAYSQDLVHALPNYGPGLAHAWSELVASLDAWSDAPNHSRGFREAGERLRAAAQGVSDQLAAVGLGYHVEADVFSDHGAAHGTIFTFRVEDVVFVRVGGEPRRVLSLRRLDKINVTHGVLGMQTEELGDPVVLLDQVDDFVNARMANVVTNGEFVLGDPSYASSEIGERLSEAAGAAIERELAFANRNRAAITRVVVATVRRHEARHGYDNDHDPLPYPWVLSHELGTSNPAFVQRARAELSAYTSQIASDPITPQLALWNLAQLGFNKDRWGSAESYVAVVVIAGLARELGIPTPGDVIHDGHIDRSRLAQLALALAHESDDALRRAARQLWQHMYEQSLIATQDGSATL